MYSTGDLTDIAVARGATVLLVPTSSARGVLRPEFSNPDAWQLVLRFDAMVYGVPILMANRVGTERGLHC